MLEFSENLRIPPGLKVASGWRRIAAALIDLLLFVAVLWASILLAGLLVSLFNLEEQAVAILMPTLTICLVAIYLGIYLVMLDRRGQTPAKRILRLRIVTPMGGRPSSDRMFFLRYVVPRVLNIATFGMMFFVDVLYLFSQHGRSLHDRMAGTIVIDLRN